MDGRVSRLKSGKKSENFHANYSSEKVGDGVDNNNERSNDNVNNDKRCISIL